MISDQYYRETPKTTTYVNVPTRKMGVRLGNGKLIYPDILAIDRNNRVQKAVEIETVMDDECARRLIVASSIAPSLDIYVVHGYGEKTKRILDNQNMSYVRIFEYYFTPMDRLIVKPVREPAGAGQG
jgi:hypothetical protein